MRNPTLVPAGKGRDPVRTDRQVFVRRSAGPVSGPIAVQRDVAEGQNVLQIPNVFGRRHQRHRLKPFPNPSRSTGGNTPRNTSIFIRIPRYRQHFPSHVDVVSCISIALNGRNHEGFLTSVFCFFFLFF